MTWRPPNYADHMAADGENFLNAMVGSDWAREPRYRALNSHPNRWYVTCRCSPAPKPAFLLVDTRAIDPAIVEQDWACDTCWTTWVWEAAKTYSVLADYEINTRGLPLEDVPLIGGQPFRPSRRAEAQTLGDIRAIILSDNSPRLSRVKSTLARELKESGYIMTTTRLHAFTKSRWIELLGGPQDLIDRYRGTEHDFMP